MYNLQGSDGLWSESVHVGEVGGNNLGLFGALPTSDSTLIISHSFQVHDTPLVPHAGTYIMQSTLFH